MFVRPKAQPSLRGGRRAKGEGREKRRQSNGTGQSRGEWSGAEAREATETAEEARQNRAAEEAVEQAEEQEERQSWPGLGSGASSIDSPWGSSCNVWGSCCRCCHVANMARQFGQEPSVGAKLLTEFACDVATRAVFFASIFVVFSFLLVSTGNGRARDKLQIKCACSGAREKTLAENELESVGGGERRRRRRRGNQKKSLLTQSKRSF